MFKEAFTTQEMMPLLGVTTESSVLRRAKQEAWEKQIRPGRGGGFVWLVNDKMPEATRAAIASALVASAPAAPPALSGSDVVIPDWAFDMGRARARLVMEWRAFVARAAGKGRPKMQASEEFFTLLQAGHILPAAMLETLGQYSLKSIYRWDKQLRENGGNLEVLADKRGKWQQGGAKGLGQLGMEVESLLLGSWLTPNKPSMRLAYNATKALLETRGETMPSYDSARRFLQRFDEEHHDLVTLKREGEKALRDTVGPYIARNDKILAVGDVLFADGHTLNFMSLHPITGKPCRLTLITWFDWRSRMPVGWEIMPEETVIAIASALHMGIRNLGKVPKVPYIDNGKAFRGTYFTNVSDFHEFDGLYIRLGMDPQYSKPYAAQTKIVERFWGTFNEQCARLLPSYCGNSIDDKPAYLKRAENYHKARHNDFIPNVQETAQIFSAFVNWYANNPHEGLDGATPWSVFEPGRGPGVDVAELDRHFLLRKKVTPKRTGFVISGIRFESDALYGLNKDVLATYSWADLSEVGLYDIQSGKRIGTARPVESLNPLAKHFGDSLDMQKVAAANKRQQSLRRSTFALAKEIDGSSEALMALPWMRPAAERRTTLQIRPGGKAVEADKAAPAPALTEAEFRELEAMAASLKAAQKNAPSYDRPTYFSSELERYEYLFDLAIVERITLTSEDATFMAAFEESPAYKPAARRFDDLRAFFAQKQPQEAIA